MLPESKFPVTGGIMQTEEVLPRAHSTKLDDSVSEIESSLLLLRQQQQQQQAASIKFAATTHHPYPLSFSTARENVMAVKQEPQEDDDHDRHSNKLSQLAEGENTQSIADSSSNPDERESIPSVQEYNNPEASASSRNGSKKSISNRGRRKSRWKLKFHHQALPPEYLDHYEAALAQESLKSPPISTSTESPLSNPILSNSISALNSTPTADVQTWLQRLASMQNNFYSYPLQQPYQPPPTSLNQQTTGSRRSVITSTPLIPQSTTPSQPTPIKNYHQKQQTSSQRTQAPPNPRPPMKYSDLPYMGEITLDNSKPRRGRKPKKADICHLIYKNYGTILPGTPGLEDSTKPPMSRDKTDNNNVQLPMSLQRTDIQNRISSLLEKRLTQEKRSLECGGEPGSKEQEEPLNLCIRDLNFLKIRLADKGNKPNRSEESSDAEEVNSSASCENIGDGEKNSAGGGLRVVDPKKLRSNEQPFGGDNLDILNGSYNDTLNNNNDLKKNSDLLYWPNAGVFLNPSSLQSQFLYYQTLAQKKGLALDQGSKDQGIVPKSIYSMLETPNPVSLSAPSTDSTAEEVEFGPASSPRSKRNSANQAGQTPNQPVKRKRSAIFIPPMPTENNTNPATEVSICKFKFTGGAKPSLQEKKSLSVDSGGNFRYYSGTGDKSMRGYEFFPRETLQQPANLAGGSSAGAFLNAAAERVPQVVYPGEFNLAHEDRSRKRKTRKSMQREKLEQTFKEKGFLIQTQQLESAEGATYCKFRQLRKFTRYLFRSWKDYLPGNVRELTESGEPVASLKEIDPDLESLPPVSPTGNIELHPNFIEPSAAQSLTLN